MQKITNIKDLESNLGNFTIVAKVIGISPAILRQRTLFAAATIADETGIVTLNLYGKQVDQVKLGVIAKISGCFSAVNGEHLELHCWKDIETIGAFNL